MTKLDSLGDNGRGFQRAEKNTEWNGEISIPNETQTTFLDGTPIKSAKVEVTHGTGQVAGTNWLSLDLTLADGRVVPAGGYRLRNGQFYTLTGDKANHGGNRIKPVFQLFEDYFKEKPQDLEKIKEELK